MLRLATIPLLCGTARLALPQTGQSAPGNDHTALKPILPRLGWQRDGYLISPVDVGLASRRITPLAAAAAVTATAAVAAVVLSGGASHAQTAAGKPTLKQLVAQATRLSNQVDSLGQQYDAL